MTRNLLSAYLLTHSARVLLLSLLFVVLTAFSALAAVGSIVAMTGQVSILRGGKLPAETATVGAVLNVGDFVRTKSNATAQIRFTDGNVIKVAPRSRIDISEYAIDRDTRTIGLARGKVEAVVVPPPVRDMQVKPKRFEIHTPNAVAGVRGTDLIVFYEGNATGVLVISLHGGDDVYAYGLSRPDDVFDLPAGYIIHIRDNQLPESSHKASDAEINALIRDFLAQLGTGDLTQLLANLGGSIPEIFEVSPAYEVGRVDMTMSNSNGLYSFNGSMTASFLSPAAGGDATNWVTNNFTASWTPLTAAPPFDPTVFSNSMSGSVPNGDSGMSLNFTNFDTASGQWSASVTGYYYPAAGGYQDIPSGSISGGGASGATSGSLSGSGGGTLTPWQPYAP